MMGKVDPVGAACAVIRGFCTTMVPAEEEISALFDLIVARLLISVTKAKQRRGRDPDNAYWQISVQSAWALLAFLKQQSDYLVTCHFRHACGLEPCIRASGVRNWLRSHFNELHPITGVALTDLPVTVFDWSVGSADLGDFADMADVAASTRRVFERMTREGASVGIGRYNEPRPVYTTPEYAVPANDGHFMRTIHIGLDVFMPAGTPLFAPLDGVVEVIVNNQGDKEYGPLLIVIHDVDKDIVFYTLYGHLSLATLDRWRPGDQVRKGQQIAEIGPFPENGNWVPHVHFQVLTDLLGYTDDYPGVAAPEHRAVWMSLCPDPNLMLDIHHPELAFETPDTEQLLRERTQHIGPNVRVSYRCPLHIVRGWKTRLFDAEGRSFLDTRNNIAHVGHEHPRLTRAASAQIALLNTNTRYLHDRRIACAEALLATLPTHLRYIYFVNSGSEANDLALRMARTYTGQETVVVLDQAYHGHTRAVLDVSPYKFNGPGGSGCPKHTVVLPVPDPFRAHGAPLTQQALDLLHHHPGPAAPMTLIHEALPSCAGQLVPPADYFRALYHLVHQQGGVCIADEVQTGLGRAGSAMWAFELFDIAPDIVTIGKPLGNGHPVAAVAVSEPVARAFDNGMEYFNSFGGNPVSCVIAHEVLRIVDDEGLQKHAQLLGTAWMEELKSLQEMHPVLGDVRGHGLFIGIEFCHPGTRQPAPDKASYVVQRMLDHRILTSLDGPDENVMKIKPPLSITRDEVTYFMEALHKVMGENVMQL
ncbi:MAG: aminotransferase class III-fold pyridoxal phosphate-dependent enzyme, partial [Saprospiraceae bacterium]|nr:aminotransferase class III-fold pyridoxal phosphate-dependent enzyme [Saprospiraceae bacterium]